jgi:hypothetical protein
MPEENLQKDPSENELETLRFVYEEVSGARERRLRTIEMLNQKLNWVLVSAVALFGFVISQTPTHQEQFVFQLAILLSVCAVVLCFIGLFTKSYVLGPSLEALLDTSKKGDCIPIDRALRSANKEIVEGLAGHEAGLNQLRLILKGATLCLVIAIILIFLSKIILCDLPLKKQCQGSLSRLETIMPTETRVSRHRLRSSVKTEAIQFKNR